MIIKNVTGRICLLIFIIATIMFCSKDYDSKRITDELTEKAMKIDSYAKDFVIDGMKAKRMYFQFKRNGKPFYCFRSDWIKSGKRYTFLCNSDGIYDYEIYHDDSIAYEYTSSGNWNDSNYPSAKLWHLNYRNSIVLNDRMIGSVATYELKRGETIEWVRKDNGLPVEMTNDKIQSSLKYQNYEFNLDDKLFVPPHGYKILKMNKKYNENQE